MKYHNKFTIVDNIKFHSKKEANRYQELKLLQQHKHIINLKLQPKYELQPAFEYFGEKIRAINYIADFEYNEKNQKIIEDVKGIRTREYILKSKMFKRFLKDILNIKFIET